MHKLKMWKVALVYVLCVVGASVKPLKELFDTGSVSHPTLIVSATAPLLGIATATGVICVMKARGYFLHHRVSNKK